MGIVCVDSIHFISIDREKKVYAQKINGWLVFILLHKGTQTQKMAENLIVMRRACPMRSATQIQMDRKNRFLVDYTSLQAIVGAHRWPFFEPHNFACIIHDKIVDHSSDAVATK